MSEWQWNISQGQWDSRTGKASIHIRIEADVPAEGTDIRKLQQLLTRLVAVIEESK